MRIGLEAPPLGRSSTPGNEVAKADFLAAARDFALAAGSKTSMGDQSRPYHSVITLPHLAKCLQPCAFISGPVLLCESQASRWNFAGAHLPAILFG